MKFSLLEILQKTTAELGLPQPATVLSNNDTLVVQLTGLCNALCGELVEIYDWQALTNKHTFSSVATVNSYDLPSDFSRIIDDTFWNTTNTTIIPGGLTPAQDNFNKRVILAPSYRIFDGQLYLRPTPTSAEDFVFEYISDYYVYDTATFLFKPTFTSDDDKIVFNDRLVINGIKLKYKEANGLATATAAYDYDQMLSTIKSRDQGGQRIYLTRNRRQPNGHIPDGSWEV